MANNNSSRRAVKPGLAVLFIFGLIFSAFPFETSARSLPGDFKPEARSEANLPAGLEDLVASVSSGNIVADIGELSRFSRCMNAPTHDDAQNFIVNKLKQVGTNPLIQSFSSNASGLRVTQLHNIIVRLPGTNPSKVHLITAHYDSSPTGLFPPVCDAPSPGANDNGSGVGVLLDLARLFGQNRARFTDDIELVFFDGEEFGYLGSSYYVQNFEASAELNPRSLPFGAVLNLDMVGYSGNKSQGKIWAVAQPGASFDLASQGTGLVNKYWPSVQYGVYTIGDLFPANRDPNRLSDQQAFWQTNKGTAIFLTEDVSDATGADPRYHTPGDVLYNSDGSLRLDPALMAGAGRVALAMVGSLAGPVPSRFFPSLNPLFENNWAQADRPVLVGSESSRPAGRSWLWGPGFNKVMEEPYAGSPNNSRQVAYFDKARMEITTPGGKVTNGLLVREMATGALQTGDTLFTSRNPSQVPVAGDPNQKGQNPDGPVYASFKSLVEAGATGDKTGTALNSTLSKEGKVGVNNSPAGSARNSTFIPNTGHNIPDVFWNWFQTQGKIYNSATDTYGNGPVFNWIETTGYPISEAYWIKTRVAGKEQEVLVQLFERRVLTFNPANESNFRVEMGNVGLHYFSWRYDSGS